VETNCEEEGFWEQIFRGNTTLQNHHKSLSAPFSKKQNSTTITFAGLLATEIDEKKGGLKTIRSFPTS
jgi:hypothetical protein